MPIFTEHCIVQSSPVGEDNMIETPDRVTILGRIHVDGDYVAGLHRSLAPANQPQRLRCGRFSNPMCNIAFRILYIEFNQGVRIGPRKFRHRCLLQFSNLVFVGGGSVVCEHGAGND